MKLPWQKRPSQPPPTDWAARLADIDDLKKQVAELRSRVMAHIENKAIHIP